jgi:hypothetical protein
MCLNNPTYQNPILNPPIQISDIWKRYFASGWIARFDRNRYHIVTFTVNAEKTAIQFQHSISIYGTSATNSSGGRRCYLIEGYVL